MAAGHEDLLSVECELFVARCSFSKFVVVACDLVMLGVSGLRLRLGLGFKGSDSMIRV